MKVELNRVLPPPPPSKRGEKAPQHGRLYRLRGLDFCGAPLEFPKIPQKPQPETLGEGGSTAGETLMARYGLFPPLDLLLSICLPFPPPASAPSSLLFTWIPSSASSRSSQTSPDDPDLLKVSPDL